MGLEKNAFTKDIQREIFCASGGYPEEDRTCPHTAAQAIVQALMRPNRSNDGTFTVIDDNDKSVPKEFTFLSKCLSEFPTVQEWDDMFQNPSPAIWPDPTKFDPSELEKKFTSSQKE